ncbi:Cullin family protein [Apiospora saccharicola]|uniref:Cullin family protein n=1 Tax=Apiospora saccharicola TaxID=335842 RepID=A0ABR1UWW9_9PEZI
MTLGDVPGSSVIERRSMGERFLKGIREAWEEHNTSMYMTADILMYLDRGFTQGQNRPTIFAATIGLVEFKKRAYDTRPCEKPEGADMKLDDFYQGDGGGHSSSLEATKSHDTSPKLTILDTNSRYFTQVGQQVRLGTDQEVGTEDCLVYEKSATNCDQPTNNDDQPKNSGDQPKNKRNSTSAQLTAAAVKWVDRRRRQSGRCWVFGGWPDGKKEDKGGTGSQYTHSRRQGTIDPAILCCPRANDTMEATTTTSSASVEAAFAVAAEAKAERLKKQIIEADNPSIFPAPSLSRPFLTAPSLSRPFTHPLNPQQGF